MYVGQVHELYLTVRVIFGTLASSTSGPVGHCSRVRPGIHNQHLKTTFRTHNMEATKSGTFLVCVGMLLVICNVSESEWIDSGECDISSLSLRAFSTSKLQASEMALIRSSSSPERHPNHPTSGWLHRAMTAPFLVCLQTRPA